MRGLLQWCVLVGCGLGLTACQPKESAPPAPPPTNSVTLHLPHALPRLPTVRLWLGATEVEAEVCLTVPQVATGLMFRERIGPNEAMLFVFRRPDQRAFYMRNVKFPIAAAYINGEGVIEEIVQLRAGDETSVPSKSANIQFVLETAPDFFERHGLKPGTAVTTAQGRLRETLAAKSQVW
ncbi:MAG: DUF192 domain-containing protein [Verrucomicrobia bacterium]|nr:DUF192 domain-containing protein [Verrucomicrobiota bacterium]